MAVKGLHCCVGSSPAVVCRPFTTVAFLVLEHRL